MYPLVELHAHLNGCVRYSTLRELANEEVGRVGVFTVPERGSGVGSGGAEAERTLAECFEVFDWIYRVVDRRSAVARVVREAVADFAADGVAYLELRTTPRALADATAATAAGAREEYAQLVARELRSSASQHGMVARLLLSINRGGRFGR
jgi:adenosine deaminase